MISLDRLRKQIDRVRHMHIRLLRLWLFRNNISLATMTVMDRDQTKARLKKLDNHTRTISKPVKENVLSHYLLTKCGFTGGR
jgi:hypothetical protein